MNWSDTDIDHVEETLGSDGFALIFGLMQAQELRLLDALTKPSTSWEDTIRYRGELVAIRRLSPSHIRSHYPSKSEKP